MSAVKASELETVIRGLIVDLEDAGSPSLFSDDDIVTAINYGKANLFGRRPDAFCSADVVTTAPSDISNTGVFLYFTENLTSLSLNNLATSIGASTLAQGSIRLTFRTTLEDAALAFVGSSDLNHAHIYLEDGVLKASVLDAVGAVSASLAMDETYNSNGWRTAILASDGANLTLTDGFGNTKSTAYTGLLLPETGQAYIGYSNIALTNLSFEGYIKDIEIQNSSDVALATFPMVTGSGIVAVDTVAGNNGDIFGPTITWTTDDIIELADWAREPLCYAAAFFLLRQRGKDSFFRKASEQLQQNYLGSI